MSGLETEKSLRVLMLHNKYQTSGGEDVSTEAESRILREDGHHVDLLIADNQDIGRAQGLARTAVGAVWSRTWHDRVKRQLLDGRYDILHVQNFFPLISPSVYYAAHAAGVPVIQSLRNYRIACPSANLFRDGRVCTDCVGRRIKSPGIRHRCYRNSAFGSALVGTLSGLHMAAGTWHRKGMHYIAISQYVADVAIREGLPPDRIHLKPCFTFPAEPKPPVPSADRKYVLFVGRLAPEKGLDVLLDAWASIDTNITLKIVGEGDVPSDLPSNVEVLGKLELNDVYDAMRKAMCLVMPGGWPEPFGRVAIEAFAQGTPVIASDVGGIAEIIQPGVNGDLFIGGDASDLARRLGCLVRNQETSEVLGSGALASFNELYAPARNLRILTEIYATAMQQV